MWWFIEACCSLTGTAFSAEYGGSYTDKPGSHNTRDNLIRQGRTNDYSIRDTRNKRGPGDKTAAFDWTFPSAQGGNFGPISLYGARVAVAWANNDPRMYAVQEVLCQADLDRQPEGYVFYPSHIFRVPDETHEWHIHFGIIREFLNDQAAFEALFSVICGESLAAWQARTGKGGSTSSPGGLVRMFMVQVNGDPTIYVSNAIEFRGLTSWDAFLRLRDGVKAPYIIVPTMGDLTAMAGRDWMADEAAIMNAVKASAPVFQLDEDMRKRIEAAVAAAGGSVTADELKAIMATERPAIAGAVVEELHGRLDN